MAKFFGSLILFLNDLLVWMPLALAVYAIFVSILLSHMIKSLVLDGMKTAVIQSDLEKAIALLQSNKDAYSERVSKLFQRYNIMVFLPSLNFIFRAIFGLILIWGFKSSDVIAVDPKLFSASFILNGKALFQSGGMPRTIFILIGGLAIVEEYYLDRLVGQRLPYAQQLPDLISLILLIAAVIFMPFAFTYYWLILSVIDHILYLFYSKNKKQNGKLQTELEEIKNGKYEKKSAARTNASTQTSANSKRKEQKVQAPKKKIKKFNNSNK